MGRPKQLQVVLALVIRLYFVYTQQLESMPDVRYPQNSFRKNADGPTAT